MKSILLIAVFLVNLSAYADAVIADYTYGLMTKNGDSVKHQVTLNDQGIVTVEVVPLPDIKDEKEVLRKIEFVLDAEKVKSLESSILQLSQADIKDHFSGIVCEMAVALYEYTNHLSVATDYQEETEVYAGPLKTVLGPFGCWVPRHIYPENPDDEKLAFEVKRELKDIAEQELSKEE